MILSVTTTTPSIAIDGSHLVTPPSVADMCVRLGAPDRVDSGSFPAPIGHRNNQRHIYDRLGLTMIEHHYTRRVTNLECWFSSSDPEYLFAPRHDFEGELVIDGVTMPAGGDVREFLAAAPFEFGGGFGGGWHYEFSGFCVFVSSRGRLLSSGRRSKVRSVTSVSLSWPHDPWRAAEPTPAEH